MEAAIIILFFAAVLFLFGRSEASSEMVSFFVIVGTTLLWASASRIDRLRRAYGF